MTQGGARRAGAANTGRYNMTRINFDIESLGKCNIDSPIKFKNFIDDADRILYEISIESFRKAKTRKEEPPSLETAGPRRKIYFDPSKCRAGIVTCGGLCPGINDVIRGIVMALWYVYGVQNILGFRYGYQGLAPRYSHKPIELDPRLVEDIHKEGGSILSSSRGPQDTCVMADTLERMNINMLFTIGGDGTQRGALAIHEELKKRKLKIAIVGVPKTIDNDLCFIEKSFGFETAFSAAAEAVRGAHEEATGAPNGIVIVKLMGRQSGFIAANAALAMNDVNIVLIPEVPFNLEGENGLFRFTNGRWEALGGPKYIYDIAFEGNGSVWVVSGFYGISHYKGGQWIESYTLADGMPSNRSYAIEVAPDGSIWVGGAGGVVRIIPKK